jgi:hypothetical protein
MNELNTFVELVTKMRNAQKSYFKNRTQTDLQRSKFLEHQVDVQIEKLTKGKQVAEQLSLTPSE